MGYSEEERRIVLRNCEIGTTRELKIRDIARLPIEQIIRSYRPPLWSYEITDTGTNIFGPLPSKHPDDAITAAVVRMFGIAHFCSICILCSIFHTRKPLERAISCIFHTVQWIGGL